MRRWGIGLVLVLLACIPILLATSTAPALLEDTDTRALLEAIRERSAPLSWFGGDWPLGNHFYRPVSTLFFELDNALYSEDAAGYGWTNGILCAACVLLLFWLLRELTEHPAASAASAILFALWTAGHGGELGAVCYGLAVLALLGGLWRHSLKAGYYLPAALVLCYLPHELQGVAGHFLSGFSGRMIAWLPGRTASVMTLFALLSMAAYARCERLGAARLPPPEPGPLDPPATRSTAARATPGRSWPWGVLSVAGLLLALGSYEQAVMLPAALLGVAVTMRIRRYRVRWAWQAAFWLGLAAYLLLRRALVPGDVSGYQAQQLRQSASVYFALLDFVFPMAATLPAFLHMISDGPIMLLASAPWRFALLFAGNAAAFWHARRRWVLALAGWALSIIAFLPMAWLKPFEHYYYWPMAMRSLLATALAWVALDLLLTALSPPARRAPPRLSPAPGSLPRR